MFKRSWTMELKPMSDDFYKYKSNGYSLRNNCILERPSVNTTKYGLNSLRYEGVVLWEKVPKNLQEAPNVKIFKECVKSVSLDI